MTKSKKLLVVLSCLLIIAMALLPVISFNSITASADYSAEQIEPDESEQDSEIQSRLFASVSLSINGGNNTVIATARNDFTLFPSQVYVIVQLYFSYDYCEDYNKMILAGMKATDDLDMGKTLTLEVSTEGQERFWMARVRYHEGGDAWKEGTASARYSAEGKYMGII